MAAGRYNFTVEQGAIFTRVIKWEDSSGDPIDLSVFESAKLQIRKQKSRNSKLLIEASTENGMITLGNDGEIDFTIPATHTEPLDFTQGYYDLELYTESPTGTVRLLEGLVNLSKETTTEDES
jgi:hypothetical protein